VKDLLAAIAGAHAGSWLSTQLGDTARFHVAFSAAGRQLGKQLITDDQADAIRRAGLLAPRLAVDECGRAALLLSVIDRVPDPVQLVRDLVRRGEVRERCAVLHVLAVLPDPERYREIAVDACRTNVLDVFCAIACDNAYPARHFRDPELHQMILKALFVGAPLRRIDGLAARRTPELVRMVEAYASERRAAGRPVPEDAQLVIASPGFAGVRSTADGGAES
jgi:hypothetical protein